MIRFGIIGRNFIVGSMLAAMAAVPETEAVSIYSRSLADALKFRQDHGLRFAYDDLQELAEDPEIGAVYIASPNSCHYSQAKLMLEHGKHVLCEKPAASNAAQVRELVSLASEKGLVFLEAMRPVFADPLRIVRENLPEIGTVRQVRFDYCKVSSRMKFFREGIYVNAFNPELSNAAVMDLGCYGIHSVIHLFGKPEGISARAVHLPNGFEACGTVLMSYPEFIAEVTYSKIHTLEQPSVVSGEKGNIFMNHLNHTERMWMERDDGTETDLGFKPARPNDMIFELKAFHRFVSEGVSPFRENENSILTAAVLDEARRQTGTRFPSDPA